MILKEWNLNYIPLIQYFHSPSNNLSISNFQPIMIFQKKILFSTIKKSAYKFIDLSTIDRESDLNQSINSASENKYKKHLYKSQTDSSFESRPFFYARREESSLIQYRNAIRIGFVIQEKKAQGKTRRIRLSNLLLCCHSNSILQFSSSFHPVLAVFYQHCRNLSSTEGLSSRAHS